MGSNVRITLAMRANNGNGVVSGRVANGPVGSTTAVIDSVSQAFQKPPEIRPFNFTWVPVKLAPYSVIAVTAHRVCPSIAYDTIAGK